MDFDSYRPIITGLIGGLTAAWLTARWAKRLSREFSGKSNEELLFQHRLAVRLANALFLVGLGIGIAMYKIGGCPGTDMTPLLLGFGFSGFAPLAALVAVPLLRHQRPAEAFYAFSVGQQSPMAVTYGILAIGVVMLPFGLYRLAT